MDGESSRHSLFFFLVLVVAVVGWLVLVLFGFVLFLFV